MMMMMMRRGEEEVRDEDTDKDQDEDAAAPAGGGGDTYKHPSSYATGLVGQNTSMVLVDGKPHWDGHWGDSIGFISMLRFSSRWPMLERKLYWHVGSGNDTVIYRACSCGNFKQVQMQIDTFHFPLTNRLIAARKMKSLVHLYQNRFRYSVPQYPLQQKNYHRLLMH